MLSTTPFVTGLLTGFAIAIPVGPTSLMLMRSTFSSGLLCGCVALLGAIIGDISYLLIAAFGFTNIAAALTAQETFIRLGAGLVLAYIGLSTIKSPMPTNVGAPLSHTYLQAFAGTCLITIFNPLTLVPFLALFAGFGVQPPDLLPMMSGIITAIALWGLTLCCTAHFLRSRVTATALGRINFVSGLIILGFSAMIFLSFVR